MNLEIVWKIGSCVWLSLKWWPDVWNWLICNEYLFIKFVGSKNFKKYDTKPLITPKKTSREKNAKDKIKRKYLNWVDLVRLKIIKKYDGYHTYLFNFYLSFSCVFLTDFFDDLCSLPIPNLMRCEMRKRKGRCGYGIYFRNIANYYLKTER
jgi:hypothetical protein